MQCREQRPDFGRAWKAAIAATMTVCRENTPCWMPGNYAVVFEIRDYSTVLRRLYQDAVYDMLSISHRRRRNVLQGCLAKGRPKAAQL